MGPVSSSAPLTCGQVGRICTARFHRGALYSRKEPSLESHGEEKSVRTSSPTAQVAVTFGVPLTGQEFEGANGCQVENQSVAQKHEQAQPGPVAVDENAAAVHESIPSCGPVHRVVLHIRSTCYANHTQ
jgi:hypothetical protein